MKSNQIQHFGVVILPIATVIAISMFTCAVIAAEPNPATEVSKLTMGELLSEFQKPAATIEKPAEHRRIDLINGLRKLGAPLVEKLKSDLKSGDPQERIAAARVLGVLGKGGASAVPELVSAMADKDENVRLWVVRALGPLRDPRAFFALVDATRDKSPSVRTAAMESSASLADGRFAVLAQALSDSEKAVRKSAIFQMKTLKDKRAVPLLVPLLEDVEVHSYSVVDGVKTADRNCDDAVLALEHIVNGQFMMSSKDSQEGNDRRVKRWQDWWRDHREQFLQAQNAEPELHYPSK